MEGYQGSKPRNTQTSPNLIATSKVGWRGDQMHGLQNFKALCYLGKLKKDGGDSEILCIQWFQVYLGNKRGDLYQNFARAFTFLVRHYRVRCVWLCCRVGGFETFFCWIYQLSPISRILKLLMNTLTPRNLTNVPPKKGPSRKETSLPSIHFQERTISFGEGRKFGSKKSTNT